MTDNDFDEFKHDELLSKITGGKLKGKVAKKSTEEIGASELFQAIKSTKNVKESREVLTGMKKRKSNGTVHKTLQAPLHRLEIEKIQRTVGYDELVKDLKVWEPIANEHIFSESLSFPLNRDSFTIDSAATRNEGFVARTPLEKAMDAVLITSKCNLKNDEEYTQEELELIKAMNLAEAKEKLSKLRKLRALQSYQDAKFRRQKKIKSKNYHRILKRAKRREELKELDELIVRDPEAAKAKLEELDKDRVYERATLKHRSQNKLSKVLARHASKDPNARKLMEDHIRFGKEMKEKISMGDDEEELSENDETDIVKENSLIEDVLNEADKEEIEEKNAYEKIMKMRKEKLNNDKKEKAYGAGMKIEITEIIPFDEPIQVDTKIKKTKKGKRSLNDEVKEDEDSMSKKRKEDDEHSHVDVDKLFDEVEEVVNKKGCIEVEVKKDIVKKKKDKLKRKKKEDKNEVIKNIQSDSMLDPNNYLFMETAKLDQVGADMAEGNQLLGTYDGDVLGEAFIDDDVMVDFNHEKDELEKNEKESDIDLTLVGWGSWTGPGICDEKKKFVIKAKNRIRKDNGKIGVIISEKRDRSMDNIQPKNVPFPFTRCEDYEASLSQPIGKEWNSLITHSTLVKPSVVTMGGRSILPMSKKNVLETRMERIQHR